MSPAGRLAWDRCKMQYLRQRTVVESMGLYFQAKQVTTLGAGMPDVQRHPKWIQRVQFIPPQ